MRDRSHDLTGPARAWLALAVGVLLLAGLLALLLVLARMPPFDALVTDAGFFRRCLVVHVNLSLVLWFPAFTAVLLLLLPPAGAAGRRLAAASPALAAAGVAVLVAAAWVPGTRPIMANYVPMIDHWWFGLGQGLFALGLLALVLSRDLWRGDGRGSWLEVPAVARSGLRAAAVAIWLVAATFLASVWTLPAGLDATARYELLFWGAGHVLQVVSVAAMLVCWILLLTPVLGCPPIGARTGVILFGILVLPWLAAPVLAAGGTWTGAYRVGFTRLMQFGIFPVVLAALVLALRALWRARRQGRTITLRDPRIGGFVASVVLTLAGFLLGAAIHGSNTVVPAHYHASIGAVTVAFMACSYQLLPALGRALPAGRAARLARLQPLLYGGGQLVFALGFGLAGLEGAGRKIYGVEQAGRGALESLGLTVMGLGGIAAIAGGVLFLGLLLAAWRNAYPATAATALETVR